jgi:predicted RNA-binding protein with PIN domain
VEPTDGTTGTAAPASGLPGVDWDDLPEPVRLRLADLAAGAVAELPSSDVPAPIRPVARFAPAKRARHGGPVLLAGLRDSLAFRAAVAQWARRHRPELFDAEPANAADAASAALLLGEQDAGELLAEVARRSADARLRAERDAALAKVDRLEAENRRLLGELDEAAAAAKRAGAEGDAEASRLRRRLREQGVRLREALDRAEHVAGDYDAELVAARRSVAAMQAERDRERERADLATRRAERAVAQTETARQAAREARAADDIRLALLLDTVAGAAAGLRRELALGDAPASDGPLPADLIQGGSVLPSGSGRADDPAALDRLLALPAAHLVVDGYNVTKTGYPNLTLSDQRTRLIGQLAALAARTAVEITVVFDGAAVVAVPTTTSRGVRVLFSEPGVLADDVIRSLVAAEPEGRPVIVVTSDQAVAASARRSGAHSVPSAVLIKRFTRA